MNAEISHGTKIDKIVRNHEVAAFEVEDWLALAAAALDMGARVSAGPGRHILLGIKQALEGLLVWGNRGKHPATTREQCPCGRGGP